jgi:hypothetical protein
MSWNEARGADRSPIPKTWFIGADRHQNFGGLAQKQCCDGGPLGRKSPIRSEVLVRDLDPLLSKDRSAVETNNFGMRASERK